MNESLQAELAHPLFLEVGPHASPSDLESYVNQVGIEARRAASAYVFRVSSTQLESLRGEDALLARTELVRKASDVPLFALSFDGVIQLHRIDAVGVTRIISSEEEIVLDELRILDLRDVVEASKDLCFMNATHSQHFIAPSGEHCEAFFRLGDAIRSKSALDRLVFWTSPFLASAGGVIVDNWSIASVALRTLQQANRNIPFDCLACHPGSNRQDAELIISRMIKDELTSSSTLVFLVSVTSSGSYASIVREIASDYLPNDRIKVIAMYGLAETPDSVHRLCTLNFDPKNYHPEVCALCLSGKSSAIPLDPGLYYLKAYPEKPVTLRKEHFVARAFIDRYHFVPGIFNVHRDDRLRRHHAFHVNVRAMLTSVPEFGNKCREALARWNGLVDLLITPADDVSGLSELATQQLGVQKIAADSLRYLSETESNLLAHARRILIIDDVLISGSRIEGYVKALREQTNEPEAVYILVGLGRPPSSAALQQHRNAWTNNVPWRAELIVLEEFCLPDWRAAECPWCHEFKFLSHVAQSDAEPCSWLTDRIRRLAEREAGGVQEGPLLLLPEVTERNLGHGSLVGPEGTSTIASLFSIASALQFLRNDAKSERKLEAGFPLYQVMAAKNLENYSESLLRAILLRAVAPKEWGVGQKQLLEQLLVKVCRGGNDADLISGEILLAAYRGALDRSVLGTLGLIFEKQHPQSGTILRALSVSEMRSDERANVGQGAGEHAPKYHWKLWLLIVFLLLAGAGFFWLMH